MVSILQVKATSAEVAGPDVLVIKTVPILDAAEEATVDINKQASTSMLASHRCATISTHTSAGCNHSCLTGWKSYHSSPYTSWHNNPE